MVSPDKSPQIGIHGWGTRVCVSNPTVSVSLCCSDSCVCFTGLIMSLSVFLIFFSSSFYPGDWTRSSLQVHLLPWLAGNYYPGDSNPFQELRGHQAGFLVHRVFLDLLKFSELLSPHEITASGNHAELLVRPLCAWCCQRCSHPRLLEQSLIP